MNFVWVKLSKVKSQAVDKKSRERENFEFEAMLMISRQSFYLQRARHLNSLFDIVVITVML